MKLNTVFLLLASLHFLVPAKADLGSFWLDSYGLEDWEWDIDHDLDGLSARAEYQLGSDPRVPNQPVQLDFDEDTLEVVLWDSVPGVVYQPEKSTDLEGFSPMGDVILGDGLTIELEMDLTLMPDVRFFRVSAVAPGDTDGDGLSSVEEAILGTDPGDDDTDNDDRKDGDEIFVTYSDPLVFDSPGATIRGTALTDPNGDGDPEDGSPIAEVTVYLDGNFNGQFDSDERHVLTDANGDYEFIEVPPGLHHVRQVLPAPNIQTLPASGATPVYDMLPDEVANYTHAAPGVGNFDEPYGEYASDDPGQWGVVEPFGTGAEPVSVGIVLKPIGIRNISAPIWTYYGTEALSLPMGAAITVRFDEAIFDGPGSDFLIYPTTGPSGGGTEEVEVSVGTTESALTYLKTVDQSATVGIDLADFDVPDPIHFVKLASLSNGGAWKGFELTGFGAVNIAPEDPDAHKVIITAQEIVEDRDFARYARDLPPTVILGVSDNEETTSGVRVGESATAEVRAFDDYGIASLDLKINGLPATLVDNRATFTTPNPGNVHLEATAVDTGGNTVTEVSRLYVLNADGTLPFAENEMSLVEAGGPGSPEVRILSPGAGTVSSADVDLIVDIIGSPPVSTWVVEYAPVDDINPYDMSASDPDYIEIASGTGNVYSSPVATLPLSTLADGIYFVRVRGDSVYYGQVIAKNVSGADLRPQITIDSPSYNAEVMVVTDITGTIASTRPLREWYVDIADADQVDPNNIGSPAVEWERLASGVDSIDPSAVIASVDATVLKSGSYMVRIVAWNDIGLGWLEPLALEVTGDVKLGRNRLSFTDVSVDLAGFPLQFTRVYDSFQADEDGELGYGWSISVQDADIRETVPDTGSNFFGATPFYDGARVYITAPTGERLGFTFRAEFGAASLFGSIYKAVFEPDLGVYHTLEVPEGDQAFLTVNGDGTVYSFFINLPYNPSEYILTDPSGNRYTYHEDEGFLQAEDPNGNTITLNPNGIEHSAGSSISFGRDGNGRIDSITAPGGGQWAFGYDGMGDLTTVTDPEGRVTMYHYLSDPAHYLDRIEDPLGRMPVKYEYDAYGRLAAVIDEDGNRQELNWDPGSFSGSTTSARGFETQIVYDERGNVTQETDPLGNVTTYAYEDPVNPDKETSMTSPNGDTWRYSYDARGNQTETLPPIFPGQATTMTYNEMGQITSMRDFNFDETNFTYDDRGNLLTQDGDAVPEFEAEYSPEGLQVALIESDLHQQFYEYDSRGHLAKVSDTIGSEASIVIDADGNLTSLTDVNGNTSTFTYDSAGLPVEQTSCCGAGRSVVDNGDGTFTSRDANGLESTVKTDARGRTDELTLVGGAKVTATRDASGNLATLTDPIGNAFSFDYDAKERLTSITDAAGGIQGYEYDSRGLGFAMTTASGKRRTFEYDANERLTKEEWLDTDDSILRMFTYSYLGTTGRLLKVEETANGGTHTHNFTGPNNALNTAKTTYAGQAAFQINYTWDRVGSGPLVPRRVQLVRLVPSYAIVGDIRADYIANKAYSLTWGINGNAGGKGMDIIRNADGSIKTLNRLVTYNDEHSSTHFGYSPLGPVTSIRHEDPAGILVHASAELTYTRDAGNRITSMSHSMDTASVTYDSAGGVAGVTHTDASYADESYTYDAARNRLGSHLLSGTATVGAGNRVTAIGDFTFAYDADGNASKRTNTNTGEVTNFGYDHRNRLVMATVHPSEGAVASTTVNLGYDYANRLVSREINGAKTWILYDRDMPMAEFADGATEASTLYFYSLDRLDDFHAMWNSSSGESWFLKDHLGSVRGLLDATGAFVSWVDYDAYGNILGTPPAGFGPIRYAGRFYLEELGLYENRRRYYDPIIGRFTQPDPIHIAGGDMNLYAYVANNPLDYTDPMGTSSAIQYGLFISGVAGSFAYAFGLGEQIAECLEGIATQISRPGVMGGNACVTNFPLPGPFPWPLPGFDSLY